MAGPPQSRLGDKSMVPADSHGCPACPHPCIGPAVGGSPDVLVNNMPALRVGDPGVHAACCGPNTWKAKAGSGSVFINGKKAHRQGDSDKHCGGTGMMVEGSPNVFTGGGGGGGIGVTFSTPVGDVSLSADLSGNVGASVTTQTVAGTSVTVGAEGNLKDGSVAASVEAEGDVVSGSAGVEMSDKGEIKGSVEVKKGDTSVKLSADGEGNLGVEAGYKDVKVGATHDLKTGKTGASLEVKTGSGTEFKAGADTKGGFNASVSNGANQAQVSGKDGKWQASATAAGPDGMVSGQVAGDKGPHGNDVSIPVGPGVVHLNDDGQLSGGLGVGGVNGGDAGDVSDLFGGDADADA